MVGSRVEYRGLRHGCCVIADDPAVIGIVVLVRSPGDINNSIDQSEARSLMFILRIERYLGVHRPVSGSGDEYGIVDGDGAPRLFIPARQIQCVEALEKSRGICNRRLADDIERVRA